MTYQCTCTCTAIFCCCRSVTGEIGLSSCSSRQSYLPISCLLVWMAIKRLLQVHLRWRIGKLRQARMRRQSWLKLGSKYSKTCLKRPLKNRKKNPKGLKDKWLLNEGQKYCRMLFCSILQYFWPALSDNQSWKPILVFFLSGRLRQVWLQHRYSDSPSKFSLVFNLVWPNLIAVSNLAKKICLN